MRRFICVAPDGSLEIWKRYIGWITFFDGLPFGDKSAFRRKMLNAGFDAVAVRKHKYYQ